MSYICTTRRVLRGAGTLSAFIVGAVAIADVVYMETFEQYETAGGAAPLVEQSDWQSEYAPLLWVVSDSGLDGQALRHVNDPTHPFAGIIIEGFDGVSPEFPTGFGRLSFDVRITTDGSIAQVFASEDFYQFVTQDPETGVFNARVFFLADGRIGIAAPSSGGRRWLWRNADAR